MAEKSQQELNAEKKAKEIISDAERRSAEIIAMAQEKARFLPTLSDVYVKLEAVLGSTNKPLKEVVDFAEGVIIELDRLAGEPVILRANGKDIAQGEVVVIDENFGVRITDVFVEKP